MKTQISEVPKHPIPARPQPEQPQSARVQQPMVFVYEKQTWEYKVVTKSAEDPLPTEEDLNAMGKSGWELVGIAALPGKTNFFFKRARV